MLTRAQETVADALAMSYGRVAIQEGYEHGEVRVVNPDGFASWLDVNGNVIRRGGPYRVDWQDEEV
jgi:hypothetical protein